MGKEKESPFKTYKRKGKEDYVPEDVRLKVHILPAFKITVEGHPESTWYGDTAIDTLRRMRQSFVTKQVIVNGRIEKHYGDIRVTTDDKNLIAATGWEKPTFD